MFAASLGIPRRGFDRDHYDIPAERYDSVVAAGATPVSSRELIRRLTAAGLRRRKADVLRPKPPGHSLVRPPRLRAGDAVAVVSPSGPVAPDRLAAGVDVLASWGLDVRVGAHAAGRLDRFAYLSADDETRAAELTDAWCDPEVRAVVCARGGYGAQRMVDLLDWQALAAAGPKVLLGFSDVTALHQAFGARLGLSTLHGPVVTSSLGRADERDTRTHLRSMLLDPVAGHVAHPGARDHAGARDRRRRAGRRQPGAAGRRGRHPRAVSAAGSIVVLEDVAEELYRVDRLLTQLLRSGWFDGVLGVVARRLHRLRVAGGGARPGAGPARAARRARAGRGAVRPRDPQPGVPARRPGGARRRRRDAGAAGRGAALAAGLGEDRQPAAAGPSSRASASVGVARPVATRT